VTNPQNKSSEPEKFHFWRIMIFCWAVVAMCGFAAWVVSTYFYE
jgi:hypothetical protein